MNVPELPLVFSLFFNLILLVISAVLFVTLRKQQKNLILRQQALEQVRQEKSFFEGQMADFERIQQQLLEKEALVETLRQREASHLAEIRAVNVQQQEQLKASEDKLQLLKESREQLKLEFEQLAGKMLEAKTDSFQQQQQTFFDQTMLPLKQQLSEFRQRMDSVHETQSKDRVELLSEINHLKNLNQQMADEAINLTNALKGNTKFQGNWGELVLERVLEDSGLRKGYEYDVQVKQYDESGKLRLPDVIVHLPDEKDLIIDAKVSLTAYQRYCESDDSAVKDEALKAHLRSLTEHIKGLSIKDYEQLAGVNTLDFVFMFVPVEAAFLLALDANPNLFQQAYDKHIILVSPSTLLATLRTVENLWRYERQNKNAEEIARQAGALYDQCVLVLESLEEVGRCLGRTEQAYDSALKRLSSGRGNVIRRIETLKKLGAKTKKQLPANMADINDEPLTSIEDSDTADS